MPQSTDKITLTAAELESHIAEEVQNRLAVERASRPPLTTNEHLAIRAWLNFTIFGKDRYAHGDQTTSKLLLSGVVDEQRVLEIIHAEREYLKGAARRYDPFFAALVLDSEGDSLKDREPEDEEGEDA